MAELAGKSAVVKVSGTATAMVGEATTAAADLTYQITSATKQVLDRTATIQVHKFSANDTAEAGTTNTTNIKMTAHGLVTGDLIINTTRSNAARIVTYVDANNVTVATVTSQTTGDTIGKYPTEATTAYSLNRLNGTVTYVPAVVRVIYVSGDYLPMSSAAYAHDYSYTKEIDAHGVTAFLATHKSRIAGQKYASGTLSDWEVTSTYFADALTAGVPVVLEFRGQTADNPERVWALLNSQEITAAVAGAQDQVVKFISTEALLTL
jgi:hypothetical protein